MKMVRLRHDTEHQFVLHLSYIEIGALLFGTTGRIRDEIAEAFGALPPDDDDDINRGTAHHRITN